jgi:hypothetical protein
MCLVLGKISKEGPERSVRFIMFNIFMDVKNYAKFVTDLAHSVREVDAET